MPSTSIRQNATIILFFALLSVSGLLFMAINTGQRFGPLPPQYRVSFEVKDADGLVEGSDVRIAGIPVGKVMAIQTTSQGARVDLGIDPGKGYDPIYTDGAGPDPAQVAARREVRRHEARHLQRRDPRRRHAAAEPGVHPGRGRPGLEQFRRGHQEGPLHRHHDAGPGLCQRGADVNATIPELRRIAEHLTPVSSRFKDRTAQIDHILVDTDTILTTLADEHAQLATLLQSADGVTGTIAANDQHLAGLLNNGGDLFSKFNLVFSQQNSDQQIRTSLEQAPALLTKLNTFLDLTGRDINSVVPSLLLGQQFNYPNDQLTVAVPAGLTTDKEWDSGIPVV